MTRLRTPCPGPGRGEGIPEGSRLHTPNKAKTELREEEAGRGSQRPRMSSPIHSFIKHVYWETGPELHAGDILSNKMSQVTVLEEGEHAGANNHAGTKGTGWQPTSEKSGRAPWWR